MGKDKTRVEKAMDIALERLDYIIPVSIHETLFIPVIDGMSVETLNEMICQVNEAEVRACERLSNHCYLWDGNEQKVKMAA